MIRSDVVYTVQIILVFRDSAGAPYHRHSGLVDDGNLKDGFGGIQANHGNANGGRFPFSWFSRPGLWHIDAVRGRPPHLDH
jgi:hypothetical protein